MNGNKIKELLEQNSQLIVMMFLRVMGTVIWTFLVIQQQKRKQGRRIHFAQS